jgi:phospholipase C
MPEMSEQGASNDRQRKSSNRSESAIASESRRTFLKAASATAAIGAANLAGFGGFMWLFGDGVQSGQPLLPQFFQTPTIKNTPGMQHVVVLMGENRSFDNLLGHLYTPKTLPPGQKFEGLAFGTYSNTAPDGTVIPAHIYRGSTEFVSSLPTPDPGEEYQHVNTQVFGKIIPKQNNGVSAGRMRPPYNLPKDTSQPAMTGFVADYASKFRNLTGRDASPKELTMSMGGFSPAQVPVLSTLAQQFGVFDHWFAAVPSQTYCNRSFFVASTSHGFVNNQTDGGYNKWFDAAPSPTIFNRMEDAGVSWRIYYDALQLVSMTGLIHAPSLEQFWHTEHFATMDQFYDDVKSGNLPAYAFVEPRLVFNHNDFHPPVGQVRESDVDGVEVFNGGVSDVRAGDALVYEMYMAIKDSDTQSGSNSQNTMFVITFDEHGGLYDHVPPPAATPPNDLGAGELGFEFDRLGCRVPAVVVSAYTKPGSVFNQVVHPGAMLATLSQLHGLEPLTDRDANAPTLFGVLNSATPRPSSQWPTPQPLFVPPNPEAVPPHPALKNGSKPLTEPAKGVIGLLYARFGTQEEQRTEPQTYADAYNALQKYGVGLFGVPKK